MQQRYAWHVAFFLHGSEEEEKENDEKKNVSLPNIYAEKKHEGTMKD